MRTNGKLRMTTSATTAAVLTAALTACGGNMPSGNTSGGTKSSDTVTKVSQTVKETQPTTPRQDANDTPTNIPQPIPNPEPPADPAQLNVKAIANTVTIGGLPQNLAGIATPKTATYFDVVWSKCDNAVKYRVSRKDDPNDKYYQRYSVPASFRGVKDINLFKIDYEYQFMVEALNGSDQVIARGTDKGKLLYPLDTPKPTFPESNAGDVGIAPEFSWGQMKGVDGYYVEVFSGQYYVPTWRGYRKDELGTKITYGYSTDIMPGSFPAVFALVLNPVANYLWSVTAVKTDTGNASTAKAWAKANSPFWRFYCGKKPSSILGE